MRFFKQYNNALSFFWNATCLNIFRIKLPQINIILKARFLTLNKIIFKVLSDDKKRAQYDQFGQSDFSGAGI